MVKVELTNLNRVFADGTRVGPISLSVEDGELLTLLGPSGSGKTTTLRMIAGFIESSEGSVRFNGNDVTHVHPRNRNIGMVFQSIALFPNMTVFQNIAFGPEMEGWSHDSVVNRVEELADLLDIRQLLFRKISEISGGEGQRVALARALARKPGLLLLDEPLSALDPHLRIRLQHEIRRIQRELGITTIYVTHDQDEAFAISDRIAVLDDGVIRQVGSPGELYSAPKDDFVASFIGNGNILEVQEIENANDAHLTIDSAHYTLAPNPAQPVIHVTIKPEDIIISNSTDGISGVIESVIRNVRTWEFRITLFDQRIIALVEDVPEGIDINEAFGKRVSLSFERESFRILR